MRINKESIRNKIWKISSKIFPYKYSPGKYNDTFLKNNFAENLNQKSKIERCIYCFWTGNNEMSENRKRGIKSLQERAGVLVKLITPDNLSGYILPEHPLHPQFKNLSLVHKSDYLRCYFMHHYGGGYSDIKQTTHSWIFAFDELEKRKDKYIISYPEKHYKDVAQLEGKLGKDLKRNYSILAGNCAYICRSYTLFTGEWYQELLNRMNKYAPDLQKNPGNIWGDNKGYPIPWTNILGDIYHPLCLKYNDKIIFTNKLRPITNDYR